MVNRRYSFDLLVLGRAFCNAALLFGTISANLYAQSELKPTSLPLAENSPREDLRVKIFKDKLVEPACLQLSKSSLKGLASLDISLGKFVDDLERDLETANTPDFIQKFHSRAGMDLTKAGDIFARITAVGSRKFSGSDVSVFRIWALNTVNGSSQPLSCTEDAVSIVPRFGYPLQISLWLQVTGPVELGRMYLVFVPDKDKQWKIVYWHHQQWTHQNLDAEKWLKLALEDSAAGRKMAAFAKLDVAHKLLDTGPYLLTQLRFDLAATRDAQEKDGTWDELLRNALKGKEVAYTGTALADDGAAALVRFRLQREKSTYDLKEFCLNAGREFFSQPRSTGIAGFQCSFVGPLEEASKEGILGGFYLSAKELTSEPSGTSSHSSPSPVK